MGYSVEKFAICFGNHGDILGPFLPSFDFEAFDAGIDNGLEVIVGAEILGGDEKSPVEL